MYRACLTWVLSFALCFSSLAQDSNAQKPVEAKHTPTEKKLLENPKDMQAWSTYMSEVLQATGRPGGDAKAGLEKIAATEAFLNEVNTTDAMVKSRVSTLRSILQSSRGRLEVQDISWADLEKRLLDNPDDSAALNAFVMKVQVEASSLARTQPDLAEEKLNSAKATLAKAAAAATTPAANQQIQAVFARGFSLVEQRIETGRMSLADLGKKLIESPDSTQVLSEFYSKVSQEVSQKMRTQPDEAAKVIEVAKDVFQKLEAATTNATVKSLVTNYKRTIDSMSRSIEAGKKLTEMIGKDAAPLQVEAWVNGSPLTDADLKGKVVFLDFWAVWCGPCIATFPHLKEWNEKYADKGLVMIGLTNYYNYKWNEDAKKAARVAEKQTPAEEQEMLVKFAELHELKHRFAIESNRSLSQFYGVTGIPHVVVIDREGKIRLMKVGSGEANAKEIGDLLAQLLEPKAAGGQ